MEKREKRLEKIIRILKMNNASTVQELAGELDVSHMTIRRDLEVLSGQNMVRIIHGGAVLIPESFEDKGESSYSLLTAGAVKTEEKRRIGKKAAGLIGEGDIIIIDSGSTTEYLARFLPDDLNLTVLCFAMNILKEIAGKRDIKIIFSGGVFHENTLMFESPEGIALIKRNRATKAFISASGVSEKLGVTCSNTYERETKRAAISSSLKRYLVVDSSKFGKVQSDHFAELEDFHYVITDSGISGEYKEILKELGLGLYIV